MDFPSFHCRTVECFSGFHCELGLCIFQTLHCWTGDCGFFVDHLLWPHPWTVTIISPCEMFLSCSRKEFMLTLSIFGYVKVSWLHCWGGLLFHHIWRLSCWYNLGYCRLLWSRFGHDRDKNDSSIVFPCPSCEVLVWLQESSSWSLDYVEWDGRLGMLEKPRFGEPHRQS